eukprot:7389573-Prymnesium_polylepis.1
MCGCVQGSCLFPVLGCTDSLATNFRDAATEDDGSCRFPGCTDSQATNYWSRASYSDGSCVYPVSGCTSSIAINYRSDAAVDDGSCAILGCVDSLARNYLAVAIIDDGSCLPHIEGCGRSDANNFNPSVTKLVLASCRFSGCPDSNAKNFQPLATFDDGSCIPWVDGCTSSSAANYLPAADRDDGSCYFVGCTYSGATNYDPEAEVDDGSCVVVRASGNIANLGYMQDCKVFVDVDGSLSPGRLEMQMTSDATGYYSVAYPLGAPVRVRASGATAACTDTITGAALNDAFMTTVEATMATSLTTVASHLMLTDGRSAANASGTVCASLMPCVACDLSPSQPCVNGCLDACVRDGAPASVFSVDALRNYISGQPDATWLTWICAQLNTAFSISCVKSAFFCAGAEVCGAPCVEQCEAEGLIVGNLTSEQIGDALYETLATMTTEGVVALEDSDPSELLELINRTASALNQSHRNAQVLAETCSQTNVV